MGLILWKMIQIWQLHQPSQCLQENLLGRHQAKDQGVSLPQGQSLIQIPLEDNRIRHLLLQRRLHGHPM